MEDKFLLSAKSHFPDSAGWEFRDITVGTGKMLQLSNLWSQKQCLYPREKLMEKPKLPNGMDLALSSGRV